MRASHLAVICLNLDKIVLIGLKIRSPKVLDQNVEGEMRQRRTTVESGTPRVKSIQGHLSSTTRSNGNRLAQTTETSFIHFPFDEEQVEKTL